MVLLMEPPIWRLMAWIPSGAPIRASGCQPSKCSAAPLNTKPSAEDAEAREIYGCLKDGYLVDLRVTGQPEPGLLLPGGIGLPNLPNCSLAART